MFCTAKQPWQPQHNIRILNLKTKNRFLNTLFVVVHCVQGKCSNKYSSTIKTIQYASGENENVCGHDMNSLFNLSVTWQIKCKFIVFCSAMLCYVPNNKQVYIMTFTYILDLNGNFNIIIRIRCLKCNNYINSCEHRRHVFLEIFCIILHASFVVRRMSRQ